MKTLVTTITEKPYSKSSSETIVKQLGGNYVAGRDVADIAKEVRAIIKKAIKAGYMPQMKVSVKISRASMCCSLDVAIMECDETLINVDAWRKNEASGWMESWVDCGGRYSDKGREIVDFLSLVVASFQKSESHAQSDYHNTNFFSDVKIDSDLCHAQFESAK